MKKLIELQKEYDLVVEKINAIQNSMIAARDTLDRLNDKLAVLDREIANAKIKFSVIQYAELGGHLAQIKADSNFTFPSGRKIATTEIVKITTEGNVVIISGIVDNWAITCKDNPEAVNLAINLNLYCSKYNNCIEARFSYF